MKNDYRHESMRLSIPPTLLVTVIGIVPDARRAVTMYVKAPGDVVYVLGTTRNELGCSEWAGMYSIVSGKAPEVHSRETIPLYDALHRAIGEGVVRSCHDCSDGGLGVALAESAFAGGLGMDVDLGAVITEGDLNDGTILFSESTGRFVVTVDPADRRQFEAIMGGLAVARVGTVAYGHRFRIKGREEGREWQWNVEDLKRAWRRPLLF